MKKSLFSIVCHTMLLAMAACSRCPKGAVDMGIVMTREDGSTYKLYWAKSNLSESGLCANPEDYGDYFAWGETETKYEYSGATYKFRARDDNGNYWYGGLWKDTKICKYTTTCSYGSHGTVDNKVVLEPEDDVAHVKLRGKWRLPTDAEWTELRTKCTWTWTKQNGVHGILVTATNGNSIFLPAAGTRSEKELEDVGSYGYYWSSSLNTDNPYDVWYVFFRSDKFDRDDCLRWCGFSVRAVSE